MKHEEDRLQANCVRWFRIQYPNTIIAAIPNGGGRSKVEAAIMKGTGVLAGMPDLLICLPRNGYGGLFVEMKSANGRLNDNQRIIIPRLEEAGYKIALCRSLDEFVSVVREYMGDTQLYIRGR